MRGYVTSTIPVTVPTSTGTLSTSTQSLLLLDGGGREEVSMTTRDLVDREPPPPPPVLVPSFILKVFFSKLNKVPGTPT